MDIMVKIPLKCVEQKIEEQNLLPETAAFIEIPAQEFMACNPEFINALSQTVAHSVAEQLTPGDTCCCHKCGWKSSIKNYTIVGHKVICPSCNTIQNIQLIHPMFNKPEPLQ